ncbi:DUF2971 domain-containing protein [Xenorhabdus bovienii]|uniref:DUF2971 domain-containing protein n=1 Tax=Xenorhabdus bovienii TaxID=40576 RepID=UPI0023B33174|nr:DUF2971 domain-containing protein [Xenorhabdus bovienii]MDE9494885.1 DUF2971 domain-containing protein [Xenorhabdus bovienii]MDE9503235.1 DUF2971 domain-containing protein [Xenorhabdus bovienii]MDE9527103.1 DUF2971 domain-containing protein [Xenorhabdus bovienii]
MLTKKQLTLLDPATWDDRNDSYYLNLYTKKKNLERTLALCLSEKNETYHHWRVFTSKENGVCIVFDRKKLEAHLDMQKNIIHGSVKYMLLSKMKKGGMTVDDMPFLKRHAFADESEYRIIYPSCTDVGFKHIYMPLTTIRRISINPWAPVAFFNVIKATIRNISGCEEIKVKKSSLIDNKEWRRIGDEIL